MSGVGKAARARESDNSTVLVRLRSVGFRELSGAFDDRRTTLITRQQLTMKTSVAMPFFALHADVVLTKARTNFRVPKENGKCLILRLDIIFADFNSKPYKAPHLPQKVNIVKGNLYMQVA